MIKLNKYIIEKLRINKDTEVNKTFGKFSDWIKYIEELGGKIIKFPADIYIICLQKGTKLAKSKREYTYPCIEIEVDEENKQWNGYWHEDGELVFLGDDSDEKRYKLLLSLRELDRNKETKPRGNYYTKRNAQVIIDSLNELYERIK